MQEIDAKTLKSVRLLPTTVEMAEMDYKTQQYEADIWDKALQETNDYAVDYEVKIEGLEEVINGLDFKKDMISDNLDNLNAKYDQITSLHAKLKELPESKLTPEQKKFMETYEKTKHDTEVNIKDSEFRLEELDNTIKKKENEVTAQETKKKMVENHRDLRVKPKADKEKLEAQESYDNWQKLLKEQEEKKAVEDKIKKMFR
jgi:hypothetical protein